MLGNLELWIRPILIFRAQVESFALRSRSQEILGCRQTKVELLIDLRSGNSIREYFEEIPLPVRGANLLLAFLLGFLSHYYLTAFQYRHSFVLIIIQCCRGVFWNDIEDVLIGLKCTLIVSRPLVL